MRERLIATAAIGTPIVMVEDSGCEQWLFELCASPEVLDTALRIRP